jgi:kynurenine formamidase
MRNGSTVEENDVIDLTHTIQPGIPVAHILPALTMRFVLSQSRGDPVNCQLITLTEHTGTHFDVPRHVDSAAPALDEFLPAAICGPIIRLNMEKQRRGLAIDVSRLEHAEIESGTKIASGSVVLLHTGHSKLWRADDAGQEYLNDRPFLTLEAASRLVERRVKAIGLDVGGPDPLGSDLPVHKLLLAKGILIIESLRNLDMVPSVGYIFMAFPLKIRGGTGSPIRAVAVSPRFLERLASEARIER